MASEMICEAEVLFLVPLGAKSRRIDPVRAYCAFKGSENSAVTRRINWTAHLLELQLERSKGLSSVVITCVYGEVL